MIINYSKEQFDTSKSRDLLELTCEFCSSSFKKPKNEIQRELFSNRNTLRFCSRKCYGLFTSKSILITCKHCNTHTSRCQSEYKKSKNHFCSSSCFGTYNISHRKTGTRRSKLENWIESKLNEKYPNLEIHYNRKDTINSELDIYIPSLKLAFELNGIFHYEPIYGPDKLSKIQNNDTRKFQACLERGIELCIIDTSTVRYFKEHIYNNYLNIISNIIEVRVGVEPT